MTDMDGISLFLLIFILAFISTIGILIILARSSVIVELKSVGWLLEIIFVLQHKCVALGHLYCLFYGPKYTIESRGKDCYHSKQCWLHLISGDIIQVEGIKQILIIKCINLVLWKHITDMTLPVMVILMYLFFS